MKPEKKKKQESEDVSEALITSMQVSFQDTLFFEHKRKWEQDSNCFSRFYKQNFPVKSEDLDDLPDVQRELKRYEHKDAIDFTASTWKWMKKSPPAEVLPRNRIAPGSLSTYSCESGCRALYQVASVLNDRYILMACHLNVHGEHRGDLRFVEVNDRTVAKGCRESMIGNLFLGDIVAVTELATNGKAVNPVHVSKVSMEGECMWMVRSMTVLPRKLMVNVKFAVMENGMAVVKGCGEAMRVQTEDNGELIGDNVYTGDMFVPTKVSCNFTEDHHPSSEPFIISQSSSIPPYPQVVGTIYQFKMSANYTQMFKIGNEAFKKKYDSDGGEILEFCALIGYSAAKTVFSSHDDSRKFTMINPKRDGLLVRFSIDNPESQPTEGLWHSNGRLSMCSSNQFSRPGARNSVNAVVETILCEGSKLRIVARLSKDVPASFNFETGVYVQQRQPIEGSLIQDGFFRNMEKNTNGKRIIETLYGGPPMKSCAVVSKKQYIFPCTDSISLDKFQCEYVSRFLSGTPIILGNSPFGCGKSMTIVTAALYMFEQNKARSSKKEPQLLLTQSNYASVNLIEIALKTLGKVKDVKFLRYVSETNWKEMPEACRTSLDMPNLMDTIFMKWATEVGPSTFPKLQRNTMIRIVSYLKNVVQVSPTHFNSLATSVLGQVSMKKVWQRQMIGDFFELYQPDIIVVTANSLPGLSSIISLQSVSTVQIDEASQLPEYTLLSILTTLPRACFGLIGDIHQLPPYCEEELTGKLKEYGVGNAMERAVTKNMFPQTVLKCVYRCHPATTQLLGEMFYNNELISGVAEKQRNEFMTKRPHFWPKSRFPIMVVDNKAKGQPMGTSFANTTERTIVEQIVDFIIAKEKKKYVVDPSDIGVISYYSAQTSLLTDVLREKAIKCGTVDSFQGSEKEIVILCCTNDDIQEFMQLKNRLNVGMSRAKQVTILIGNVEMLKKVEHWSTIVKKCEENDCVVDTVSIHGSFT